MYAMSRMALWTSLVLLGVAVAVVDLFSGWTVNGGLAAAAVVLGLFGGAIALFVAMLIAVLRDRKWIVAHSSDARWVLARASRGLRWSSLFAIGLCLLLFANCSGGAGISGPPPPASGPPLQPLSTHGQAVLVSGPIEDPARFWVLAAWVLVPLLMALLLPPVLTFAAERLVTNRLRAARMLGRLAMWSIAAVVAAVLVTLGIGFAVGINSCLIVPGQASTGYCSAGFGSVMNLLSLGALALFLPYLGLVTWALAQLQPGRSTA